MNDWRKYKHTTLQARAAADAKPLPARLGVLAATTTPHPFASFASFTTGLGAAQCGECFGWPDDVRHLGGGRE